MKSGMEYMVECMNWYLSENKMGIFCLGNGIAADFVQCVVPTLRQDFRGTFENVSMWQYLCQITDAVTSYGGFSGCLPSEKISWGKLSKDTPAFTINSDFTIVAPLIFAYVLGL